MAYTLEVPDDGYVTTGGPSGILVQGINIPDDRSYYFDFTVCARNSNQESFGCHYQAVWERDAGSGVPVKVAADVIENWENPGSLDWGFVIEVDANNDLQFRTFGTSGGSYDTRWAVYGFLKSCNPPPVP